nr:hypothetical protein [Chloroflexota bacterium]
AEGRRTARTMLSGIKPDLLFATASEADGLLAGRAVEDMLDIATVVVIKRGAKGATVLAGGSGERIRFEVATRQVAAADTTGAGDDAFDAGFLIGWLAGRAAGHSATASLQRAALAGHRAAARHLSVPRPELPLG